LTLIDINVLVYAHRRESPRHVEFLAWLTSLAESESPFGVPDETLSGFLRLATNPAVFASPSTPAEALQFVEEIRSASSYRRVVPGPRHWALFTWFIRTLNAKANTIPDAWLAALALEQDLELITTDRGFARFPGVRWRHPLEGQNTPTVVP
jgi:uncharacterized protein